MENKNNNLITLINKHPNSVTFGEFGKGASNEWIIKAEERLKVKFPPSYKWWLENYSGGEIYGDEIYSVYQIDFDTVVGGDVVYINELSRKNGTATNEQLIIQENDQGEIYYFDLKQIDSKGEYPVFCNKIGKEYASNFLEFLQRKIEE